MAKGALAVRWSSSGFHMGNLLTQMICVLRDDQRLPSFPLPTSASHAITLPASGPRRHSVSGCLDLTDSSRSPERPGLLPNYMVMPENSNRTLITSRHCSRRYSPGRPESEPGNKSKRYEIAYNGNVDYESQEKVETAGR